MTYILVFVAGDNNKPLSTGHIAHAETILEDAGIVCENPLWLHPHKAAELRLSSPVPESVWLQLHEYVGRDLIDVFLVPEKNRRKKLLLADMDATIVEGETLDDLAALAGLKEQIAAITARAMRGELDFHAALTERVRMLKGLPVSALAETLSTMKINDGAGQLVATMRQHGAECYLVSGGFTYFTQAIAEKCTFNGHHGNHLEIMNGALSGEVIPPILDKDAKRNFLRQYCVSLGLASDDTMAVGDGANDIPMLLEAGLGIGFRPKPLVKDQVMNCVIHTDLTSLLYVQGYTWQDMSG